MTIIISIWCLLAELKGTVVGHVQNNEGIGEGAIELHVQTLHSGTRVVAERMIFFFLHLNGLYFTLNHLRNDYVPLYFEVFQVGFVKRSLI
jgi:hypothetical protein